MFFVFFLCFFYFHSILIEHSVLANSGDPDQMPHSVVSDRLPKSHKKDTRLSILLIKKLLRCFLVLLETHLSKQIDYYKSNHCL